MTTPYNRLKVMLIDDSESEHVIFEYAMKDLAGDIERLYAFDYDEAIKLLKEGASLPDLIFLDLNIPKINGYQILEKLKADDGLSKMPIVIYTTASRDADIEKVRKLGADWFLEKPSSISILSAVLKWLHQRYMPGSDGVEQNIPLAILKALQK